MDRGSVYVLMVIVLVAMPVASFFDAHRERVIKEDVIATPPAVDPIDEVPDVEG